jgi:ketosteroid isomerase-like protein
LLKLLGVRWPGEAEDIDVRVIAAEGMPAGAERETIAEEADEGNSIGSGKLYENRFISVVTIEDRKIVGWRDYMDSLAAMSSLT